ncbi:MAG: rhomboid family intramembrane serine protease [Eubacteriales bacterium]
MQKLSKEIDRFCYKHNHWGIPGLMRYIVLANVFVFLMDMFSNSSFSKMLSFIPYYAFSEGQVWRIFTFFLVPESGFSNTLSIFWFAISSMCYFFIGSALEQRWGTARFTFFYALGILLNLFSGLLISGMAYGGLISEGYAFYPAASMYYVNLSLFFSIASLYPNLQFYFMFIIPVKAKWLAWFSGAMFAFSVFYELFFGLWVMALVPVIAIFNYFLFFWDEISHFLFKGKHRLKHSSVGRSMNNTINLKTAQKEMQQRKGYLHKCTVCGVTDADNPDMDFRYCSKCEGYHCYCMDHINNHQHKT